MVSLDDKNNDALHMEKPIGLPNGSQSSDGSDIPAGYFPVSAEEKAMSRALNRKLDIFLLPFLSFLYLFNGLDRGNVGNAETQGKSHSLRSDRNHTDVHVAGFTTDIGVASADLNLAVSLFFITFVIFQPISSAVGRRVGAKHWIPFIMVSLTQE
jgi:MFS family permease